LFPKSDSGANPGCSMELSKYRSVFDELGQTSRLRRRVSFDRQALFFFQTLVRESVSEYSARRVLWGLASRYSLTMCQFPLIFVIFSSSISDLGDGKFSRDRVYCPGIPSGCDHSRKEFSVFRAHRVSVSGHSFLAMGEGVPSSSFPSRLSSGSLMRHFAGPDRGLRSDFLPARDAGDFHGLCLLNRDVVMDRMFHSDSESVPVFCVLGIILFSGGAMRVLILSLSEGQG